jgi:hypothetical protein
MVDFLPGLFFEGLLPWFLDVTMALATAWSQDSAVSERTEKTRFLLVTE